MSGVILRWDELHQLMAFYIFSSFLLFCFLLFALYHTATHRGEESVWRVHNNKRQDRARLSAALSLSPAARVWVLYDDRDRMIVYIHKIRLYSFRPLTRFVCFLIWYWARSLAQNFDSVLLLRPSLKRRNIRSRWYGGRETTTCGEKKVPSARCDRWSLSAWCLVLWYIIPERLSSTRFFA